MEGPTLVREALESGLRVLEIYAEPDAEIGLADLARDAGVPIRLVATGALDSVLSTVSPQPAVAIVERASWTLADLAEDRAVLVLLDVRDPGNVGTLCRTAEAAGFAGMVLAGSSVDPTNPKVVRAAAGASLRLPIVEHPLHECSGIAPLVDALRRQKRAVLGAALGPDSVAHDAVDLRTAAIVLGNEARGLDRGDLERFDRSIIIDLDGPTESLNVAAAGAVLCFESLRQRRTGRPGRNTDRPQA